MAASSTIDLDVLVAPFKEGTKPDQNVQYGATYRAIKEAMRHEDPVTNGPIQSQGKAADWQKVVQLSTKILTEEGKDLGVMVWLVEGLTRKHGFAGLRDGLKVLAMAHEQCWSELLPLVEEDGDLDARATRLEAVNTILPRTIQTVPILHQPGGIVYSSYDYSKGHDEVEKLKGAVQAAQTQEQRGYAQAALDEATQLGEKIDRAVASTPLSQFTALRDMICEALEAFHVLDRVATEKYGSEGFTLRPLQEVLDGCRDRLDELVRKRGGVGLRQEQATEQAQEDSAVTTTQTETPSMSGDLKTRADAIRQLQRVAEFFRRTEPHSPVPYLVQRAVRWQEMPLEEWLQELIKDTSVLSAVKETLGLRQHSNTSEES